MRFRVYQDGRFASGAVAAGRTLTVYGDEAMTAESTIYAAATGTTELDNPLTVPATGIIDFWTTDSTPWGLAQGDSTARPLRVLSSRSAISVSDYGATGDGTTDDTAAVAAAFAAVLAEATTNCDRSVLYFPSGRYLFDTGTIAVPTLAANRHWTICGDGMYATELLAADATGALLSFADYDATPTDWWAGSASQGVYIHDLTIRYLTGEPYAQTSLRTGVAIQDNGCGAIKVENVRVKGFGTGFYCPYGGDFDYVRNCEFLQNDLAVYFGPGNQQIKLDNVLVGTCYEGIVLENAEHVRIDSCQFIDNSLGDIIIESNNSLRSGVTCATTRYPDGLTTVYGCWFETGSAALQYPSASDQKGHIIIAGDHSTVPYWRGLVVRDSVVVSGTTGMETKSGGNYGFLRVEDAMVLSRATIENLTYYGAHKDYIVALPTSAANDCRVHVKNVFTRDGYTPPAIYSSNGWDGRLKYSADWHSDFVVPRLTLVPTTSATTEATAGITVTSGSAAPASGPWLVGDICFNTGAAAEGYVGWVCVTAGSPGTWRGFGLIEADPA